jgi:hypothetical protein
MQSPLCSKLFLVYSSCFLFPKWIDLRCSSGTPPRMKMGLGGGIVECRSEVAEVGRRRGVANLR